MTKDHNPSEIQSSMALVQYHRLQVMGTTIERFHQNPMKTARGLETKHTVEKGKIYTVETDKRP